MGIITGITKLAATVVKDVATHHSFLLDVLLFNFRGLVAAAFLGTWGPVLINDAVVVLQLRKFIGSERVRVTILGRKLRTDGASQLVSFFDNFTSIRT